MPPLETDEEAEKRISKYNKNRIEKRQKEAFNKNVKRIRLGRQKSESEQEAKKLSRQKSELEQKEAFKEPSEKLSKQISISDDVEERRRSLTPEKNYKIDKNQNQNQNHQNLLMI